MQCFFDLCLKGGTIDTRSTPCSQAAGKMFTEVKSSYQVALCHLMVLIPFSKHILDNRSAQPAGQSLTVGTVTCPEVPAQLRAVGRAVAWLKLLQLLVLSVENPLFFQGYQELQGWQQPRVGDAVTRFQLFPNSSINARAFSSFGDYFIQPWNFSCCRLWKLRMASAEMALEKRLCM